MDDMTNDERMGIELDIFKSAKPMRTALTLGYTIVLDESVYNTAVEHIEELENQVAGLEQQLIDIDVLTCGIVALARPLFHNATKEKQDEMMKLITALTLTKEKPLVQEEMGICGHNFGT